MFRKIAIAVVALSVVMGAGRAWAQAAADSTAPPPGAADTSGTKPPPPSTPPPSPPPSQATPALVYYEKAKVVANGDAQANGTIEMTFTPQNGTTKTFTVTVLAKATKKDVARDIHKELSIAAGTTYKVKFDNDKVKISKVKKESPNFSITIGKVQLAGVSVLVAKD
jgi:hypothetical protein